MENWNLVTTWSVIYIIHANQQKRSPIHYHSWVKFEYDNSQYENHNFVIEFVSCLWVWVGYLREK